MPFTITHITAILPISRVAPKLPVSALVIGSMLPDAPIFFSLGYGYSFLHSIPGLLLATLPLGLCAHILYQRYIKNSLISLAPDTINSRLKPFLNSDQQTGTFPVCIALLLGATTHVIWDIFTHSGRWGVENVSFLMTNYPLGSYVVSGYKIAQHGSSLLLLPLLVGKRYRIHPLANAASIS